MSWDVTDNEADNHDAAWGAAGASWWRRAVKDDKRYCSFVPKPFVAFVVASWTNHHTSWIWFDIFMLIYTLKWRHRASVWHLISGNMSPCTQKTAAEKCHEREIEISPGAAARRRRLEWNQSLLWAFFLTIWNRFNHQPRRGWVKANQSLCSAETIIIRAH